MYAVYLNIKTPGIVDAAGNDFEKVPYKGENKRTDYIVYDINNNGENDGTIITNVSGENWGRVKNLITDYIPANPNQIKHIENLGTFNPNNPNIYNAKITKHIEDVNKKFGLLDQFSASSGESVFGINGFERLVQGEAVSSSEILSHIINTKLLSPSNKVFAEIIQHHDIPVRLGELEDDTIASIYYDNQG
jgi:hypothetical protein